MTDKKLTDNEIKKALECCSVNIPACPDCPYYERGHMVECEAALITDSFNLVNRLICEKLKLLQQIENLQAENERLRTVKKHIDILIHRGIEYPTAEAYEKAFQKTLEQLYDNTNAKVEAYKECIEKVKEEILFYSNIVEIYDFLDNLLKELTNEQPPNDVKCIDCEYLEINGAWGVCAEAHKMVHSDDCCGKGKLKGDDK